MSDDKRDDKTTDDDVTVVRSDTDYPMIEVRSGGEKLAQPAPADEPDTEPEPEVVEEAAAEETAEADTADGLGMVIHRGDPYPRATPAEPVVEPEAEAPAAPAAPEAPKAEAPQADSAPEPETEKLSRKARKAAKKAESAAAGAGAAAVAEVETGKRKLFGKGKKNDDAVAAADAPAVDVADEAQDTATTDTESETTETVKAADTAETSDSKWTRKMAGALALLTLGFGGLATFFAFHPGAEAPTDNVAFENGAQTSALMSQATERACAPFTYDYRTLDKDMAHAAKQFTGPARKEFDKFVATTTKQITDQAKAGSECIADTIGIASMTGDKAVVIAQLIVSTSQQGIPTGSNDPRVQYTLEKHGDQWLIYEVNDA